jgi:hypothetical protein
MIDSGCLSVGPIKDIRDAHFCITQSSSDTMFNQIMHTSPVNTERISMDSPSVNFYRSLYACPYAAPTLEAERLLGVPR